MTASVFDVALAILQKHGPMTAMKLQKLVYYCQAWHLVWEGRPMFRERIEAWASGPVVPELYEAHRGKFMVSFDDILLYCVDHHWDAIIEAYDRYRRELTGIPSGTQMLLFP